MAVIFFEDFRSYPTTADMFVYDAKGGAFKLTSFSTSYYGSFASIPSLVPGKPAEIGFDSSSNSNDTTSPFAEFSSSALEEFCFSFLVGGKSASHVPSVQVTFNDTPGSVVSAGWGANGISIVGSTGRISVIHRVPTGVGTGSVAINSLILGDIGPLKAGEVYHINGKISQSDDFSRVIIYVNGQMQLDAIYDRDRIDTGLQDMAFRTVMLGSPSNSANLRATYRNFTIYTEDASTPFPCLPFRADELEPTAGQGYDALRLVAGQASDAASVTINPGGSIAGTFDDLPSDGGAVKAVYVRARHFGTGGVAPSELDLQILNVSGQTVRTINSTIASGMGASQKKAVIPVTSKADIDGLTFRLSARD